MRALIITSLTFMLQGCGEPDVEDLVSSINNSHLIKISYEVGGIINKCEPEKSQQLLAQWSNTLKKPEIGSWVDADEYINLEFDDDASYRANVTFTPKFGYSTIRMGSLHIGEIINIGGVCKNT